MFSFFAKRAFVLSQTPEELVLNNSALDAIRKALVFLLLLTLLLDASYLFIADWNGEGTLILACLTFVFGAASNLNGCIRVRQYEIEKHANCLLFHKVKKIKIQDYSYIMVREIIGTSDSYDKNPIPFFEMRFSQQKGVLDENKDICLHDVHIYERDLSKVSCMLKSLQHITKLNVVFYKKNDVAIDADINRLEALYQQS